LLEEAEEARLAALEATRHRENETSRASGAKQQSGRQPRDAIEVRKEVAERLKTQLAKVSPVVEARPAQVSDGTRQAVHDAIERGARIWAARPDADADGYIIGLDVGTSAVKCAYRQPYRAGDPVKCLTVPSELRSFAHPCLWQTALWHHPEFQTFDLIPSDGAVVLEGFKSGLIADQGRSLVRHGIDVSQAEAMTAFIALKLAYALGAYDLQRPLGKGGADHYLSINIGVPVAAHDDRVTRGVYERVVVAARELASISTQMTLADVRGSFARAQATPLNDIHLIPELVAAMSGYASDPTSPRGAHMLVDVGASTLDMVSFNLQSQKLISIFTACVEMLGSAALDCARAAGVPDKDFKRACDEAFERVYSGARKKAPSLFHPGFRRQPVQLLKTGGGCRTAVHEKFIAEMTKHAVLGDLPIIEPKPPSAITEEDCDHSRLLLAYGLTRDLQELLDHRLPSQIEDLPLRIGPMPDLIGPEQM
jgi:hypothetical protein